MMRWGAGRSVLVDGAEAAREAVDAAVLAAGGAPSALLLFATSGYDQESVVRAATERAPGAVLVGCSAEGVITPGRSDEVEHAVGALACAGDSWSFEGFLEERYAEDPAAAGRSLAAQVRAADRGDSRVLVLLTEGLGGNCSTFLAALQESLPPGITVVGGAAGDALRMQRTWQYCGDRVRSGAAAALLLRGAGRAAVVTSHGCLPIGRPITVTRAEGTWVYELNGVPAWEVFRKYLDDEPKDLRPEAIMHISVGLRPDGRSDGPLVVRVPMLLQKETGALFFPGGGLATGDKVTLVRRDADRICETAVASARRLADAGEGERPEVVLHFDCTGRGRMLWGHGAYDAVVRPPQEVFGAVPWFGFHTFGEIAPVGERAVFHQYTAVLVALFGPRRG